MTPTAILISGRGSNMQALVEAMRAGRLSIDIRVVVSNRADAPGLAWAAQAGLPTLVMPHRDWPTREAYDRALAAALLERGVRLVCLAGFMRVLGSAFIDAFPSAVINVHPSLLPAFPGTHAQAQALAYGVGVTGVTVHFVTADLDAGPIVQQAPVPVLPGDTVESLSARILTAEHQVYPAALAAILAGGWRIEGRRVLGLRLR